MNQHDNGEEAMAAAVERIADGWCGGSQPRYLYRLSRGLAGTGDIVEIGTFAGKSITAIAMGQRDAGGRVAHTVDLREHPAVAANLTDAGIASWVRRWIGESVEVARTWTAPIELLFIDAGHRYAEVRGDVDAWTPWVVEGGLVVLHDYPGWSDGPPGPGDLQIHRAVHETLMARPLSWQLVSDREHGSLIVFRHVARSPAAP
jgi:predicted O-methyltransferase YrrM